MMKTRAGWKETSVHEVAPKDDAANVRERDPRDIARAICMILAKAQLSDPLPLPMPSQPGGR